MRNQKAIEQLGYTQKEAKVYLASLSLGEAHVSDIAAKVKMPHSTVQFIVEKLRKEGLMHFYIMRRYKYWVAEKPEQLLENIKKREAAITEVLPKLQALRKVGRSHSSGGNVDYGKYLASFSTFAGSCNQAILISNGDNEIEYVNSAWERVFGYSLDEVKGRNPALFKSGKTPKSVYQEMWKTLNADKLFQSDQIVDTRKDGTCFSLCTTIFSVRPNSHIFFVQILNELTEMNQVDVIYKKIVGSTDEVT